MNKPINVSEKPLSGLMPRGEASHKGNFGRVLVVGGSRNMAGAPALAGMATLRSGAGLVTLAVPECIHSIVSSFCPAYMTIALADDTQNLSIAAIEQVRHFARGVDVVAIGPGLGRAPAAVELVHKLYASLNCAMVVDADALNALADNRDLLHEPTGPRILTPHPGEFARLTNEPAPTENDQRATAACELARRDRSNQTIIILKGHRTIIASADQYAINTTGNPGMATGGTGDVLTGITAALVGQGLPPWDAARLAVHVHGRAGDLARDALGEVSMTATDVIDYLPEAFRVL
jgi:ADP-dependent NAD(P)H-hydrate dehydratase